MDACRKPMGAPPRGHRDFRPFSFAVIADMHLTHEEGNGVENLEWLVNWLAGRDEIEFVLCLGDMASGMPMPTWDETRAMLTDAFARMRRSVHVVYGNNDVKIVPIEAYGVWERVRAYEEIWGKRDRTFEHRGCLFALMWNALTPIRKHSHEGYIRDAQWEWLEEQLRVARPRGYRHIFLAAHVPPPCPDWDQKGMYMRKGTEERFWETCAEYDITAAFFGHIHVDGGPVFTHGNTEVVVTPSLCNINYFPPAPHHKSRRSRHGHFRVVHVHADGITHQRISVSQGSP